MTTKEPKARCSATRANGTPCQGFVVADGVCLTHGAGGPTRCSYVRDDGQPCRAFAREDGVCKVHDPAELEREEQKLLAERRESERLRAMLDDSQIRMWKESAEGAAARTALATEAAAVAAARKTEAEAAQAEAAARLVHQEAAAGELLEHGIEQLKRAREQIATVQDQEQHRLLGEAFIAAATEQRLARAARARELAEGKKSNGKGPAESTAWQDAADASPKRTYY